MKDIIYKISLACLLFVLMWSGLGLIAGVVFNLKKALLYYGGWFVITAVLIHVFPTLGQCKKLSKG